MIRWLLFDLDNTLIDFVQPSKKSIWKTFADHGIECNAEIYRTYKKLNKAIWERFERKEITAQDIRMTRFEQLFEAINVSPCTPLTFHQGYMNNLIEFSTVYEGVPELLTTLEKTYQLAAVTNGLKEVQRARLDKLNLTSYFNENIVVSDEIGVAKPDPAYFEEVFKFIPDQVEKNEIMIIGDSITSDIAGGKNAGIRTCWISRGNKNNSQVRPDYVIENVGQILGVLEDLRPT